MLAWFPRQTLALVGAVSVSALEVSCVSQGTAIQRKAPTDAIHTGDRQTYDAGQAEPITIAPLGLTKAPAASPFVQQGNGIYTAQSPLETQPTNLKGSGPRDIILNFSNADVREVVRSVLGDALRLPYVVDPAVQGSITLQEPTALSRSGALVALEGALRLSNIAMIRSQGLYRIIPVTEASREATIGGSEAGSYSTRIIALRYASAVEVERVIEPILPPGVSVRVDPGRNVLIATGSSESIYDVIQKVGVFDVDYLKGLSFALLPLENAQAAAVAKEITGLLATPGGATEGLVRLVPVERLNALLVTAVRPIYLARVEQWVRRLDQATSGDVHERKLFVYRVQNGRATDLADVLRKILTDGAGGSTSVDRGTSPNNPLLGPSQVPPPPNNQNMPNALSGDLVGSLSNLSGAAEAVSPTSSGSQSAVATESAEDEMPGVRITADDENNAILILASTEQFATIQSALRQLDRQPLQVLIQATVAEITLTDQLSYGLQYAIESGNFQGIFSNGLQTTTASSIAGSAAALAGTAGLGLAYVVGANSSVILQLLQSLTKVRVLSSPDLLVLNNQSAQLQVGDEVPISTETAQSTLTSGAPIVSSIEYRDTGVILKITPRVNASGLVLLDVDQEVSNVSTTTSSTLNTPTISQRRVNSSIAVGDGQTIALAGLISDTRSKSKSGIPILQNIPYLGALFSTVSTSSSRNELIVLVTPHIVRDNIAADAVTQELREKLPLTRPVVNDDP